MELLDVHGGPPYVEPDPAQVRADLQGTLDVMKSVEEQVEWLLWLDAGGPDEVIPGLRLMDGRLWDSESLSPIEEPDPTP